MGHYRTYFTDVMWPVWRRTFDLSWPVMIEQFLRTLMRTTDMIVAGFFSPAAVAAVGLSDIYARLPRQFGSGIGDSAIALSSQDTGSGATANRDEAVTQALLIGALAGAPFVLFGFAMNEWAIDVLGAAPDVVAIGAAYLSIILAASPARHVELISARAIQGTGDTRSPMIVRGGGNAYNIVATVVLAFGVGPAPELGVVGIAVATATANGLQAAAFLTLIASPLSELGYARPTNPVIGKQLLVIATPRIAEGLTELVAEFPFNAILLTFGTEVNAAYHIGRRMYQQVASPLSRGFGIATNIIVGQTLGRGEPALAYRNGWIAAVLAMITVGALGLFVVLIAEEFVYLFTRDPATIGYAADFARAYGVATFMIGLYLALVGALRGGSETRPPFVAKITGTFVFLLGTTYLFGVHLGYGVVAAYVGIVADYAFRNLFVGAWYYRRGWLARGTQMMEDRGSTSDQS